MTKSVEIPQDIIDNVIVAVGDDTHLLKQCTLVSSSFLLPSRKQLFSRITLRNDQTCQGIYQLLIRNPVIQPFVRAITLMDNSFWQWDYKFPEWMNSNSLLAILRLPFCCLEYFSIIVRLVGHQKWNWSRIWDWNNFSSELKDALSNIAQSSNLKTLSLEGIIKVPITFFLHTVRLTTLELHSLLPSDFGSENSSSQTQASSKGVASMASHTAIDRCVWHFRRESRRGTRFSYLLISHYFRIVKVILTRSQCSCHSWAIFASLKSASTMIPQAYVTSKSCPSWWAHFVSASQPLLHSNT